MSEKRSGARLRELIGRATKGPWDKEFLGHESFTNFITGGKSALFSLCNYRPDEREANADLVILLHNNAPAIADLIEAAETVIAAWDSDDDVSISRLLGLDMANSPLRKALAAFKEKT